MHTNDLPQVLLLAEQLGYPSDILTIQKRFETLTHSPFHQLIVYRSENKINGWIHLEVVFDLIEEPKLEIKALVVDEKLRGKGIGSELLKAAKIWGINNRLHTAYLSCNILRKQTHAFYYREGFELVKTSHFFELKI